MLNRIVAVTLVALLSVAFAGNSIADPKQKERENTKQMEAVKTFNTVLQTAGQLRVVPPTKPPKVPGGTLTGPGILETNPGFSPTGPAPTGTLTGPAAPRPVTLH
jgi:hypothetical protein